MEGNREVRREITDYQISVDMAKRICMIQRNEKGKQYREYFLELEKSMEHTGAGICQSVANGQSDY